ncbi:MAG: ATP-grasp domain-containing protein [Verrucomicrobiales bacterium]|nr:ATP-grasp domain-containing protein [Verrucomicrobiales bacterium]
MPSDLCSNETELTPRVVEAIGKTPGYWDRNVIFVANLMGLFFGNEEETQMLAAEVGEIDSYGGRLLPILNLLYGGKEKNLLVLEHSPDAALTDYFGEIAGLSLPEIAILPHSDYLTLGNRLERGENLQHEASRLICDHEVQCLDGYVTDEILEGLAGRIGKNTVSSVSGSRRGNNKWLLHSYLEEIGLPVPPTEIAESPAAIPGRLKALQNAGFSSAVIKAPMGASGIGMTKVEALSDCDEIAQSVPHHFFTEGPCLVQGWIKPGEFGVETIRSPSVQLFLDQDSVVLYDLTEQILSHDSVHEGNESPPPYLGSLPDLKGELLRQAALAGQWLHRQGYRGTGSVDFLVAVDGAGRFTVYVCEINARVTGATYPAVLAKHFLPEGAWLLRNLRFSEPVSGRAIIDLLAASDDLYVPGKSESGVFPVNFNFGKDGLIHKGQFLCLSASPTGNQELLHLAEIDLPCAPDRD